jgi:hypothetical protein
MKDEWDECGLRDSVSGDARHHHHQTSYRLSRDTFQNYAGDHRRRTFPEEIWNELRPRLSRW